MKIIKVAVSVVLAAGVLAPMLPAQAAVRTFSNCTQMHRTYVGGVARVGAHDHRSGGGHAKYKPHVSTALYNANRKMDRDRDGIACEQ